MPWISGDIRDSSLGVVWHCHAGPLYRPYSEKMIKNEMKNKDTENKDTGKDALDQTPSVELQMKRSLNHRSRDETLSVGGLHSETPPELLWFENFLDIFL
ncbi:hypothetical protein JTB14_001604 [Gonioctena quinquepunctata]|nr:hypothetical protein JTB14_001604 [Gonioctena quinquepunctata]